MGCIAAKEQAANRNDVPLRREDAAERGDARNGDAVDGVAAAIKQHQEDMAARRPIALESYWCAGLVDNGSMKPPNFVPDVGPFTVAEKVPAALSATALRRRVVTCLLSVPVVPPSASPAAPSTRSQHAVVHVVEETHQQSGRLPQGGADERDVAPSGRGGAATPPQLSIPTSTNVLPPPLLLSPIRHAASSAATTSGGGSGAASIHHMVRRPLTSSSAGAGPNPADPVVPMLWYFPIPRWPVGDVVLPSSERAMLEAAEGRLGTTGDTRSSQVSQSAGRPPLPGVDAVNASGFSNAGGGGYPHALLADSLSSSWTSQLRSHYVLPDDMIVARAFLPHSLFNFSVGWIKVPIGPVMYKTTISSTVPVAHDNVPNALATVSTELHAATPSGADKGTDAMTTAVGFLSAFKPLYDVAIDGPVKAPYTTTSTSSPATVDNIVADNNIMPPDVAPRYLEKYFLYPKTIRRVCIGISWRNATDMDAPFEDVTSCVNVNIRRPSTASVSTTASSSSSVNHPAYFISLPVISHSDEAQQGLFSDRSFANASSTGGGAALGGGFQWPDSGSSISCMIDGGQPGAPPSLSCEALRGETSLPLFINTPIRILYPVLYQKLQASLEHASSSPRSGVSTMPSRRRSVPSSVNVRSSSTAAAVYAAPHPNALHDTSLDGAEGAVDGGADELGANGAAPTIGDSDVVQHEAEAAAAHLRHDDISWLAFRLKFLEFLTSAASEVITKQQGLPRSQPFPTPLPAVHLAIKFGARFAYDDQEFVAFNAYGRNNRVNGMGPPGAGGAGPESCLQFRDRTRSTLQVSGMVSEGPATVLTLRLRSNPESSLPPLPPAAPAHAAAAHAMQQQSFMQAAAQELDVLRHLFSKYLHDVSFSQQ